MSTHISVDAKTGSRFLADYRTLVATYPGDTATGGQISGDDLRKKLTRNRKLTTVTKFAAIDGLRMSYMLNKLDGHHIPKTQSQGAFIGADNKVYIYDLAALKTYLTKTYKDPPKTAPSAAAFTGERGIMMLDVSQSDGSAGSVGLWDGNKMHQIKDYTKATSVRSVTFWKVKGRMSSLCFSLTTALTSRIRCRCIVTMCLFSGMVCLLTNTRLVDWSGPTLLFQTTHALY